MSIKYKDITKNDLPNRIKEKIENYQRSVNIDSRYNPELKLGYYEIRFLSHSDIFQFCCRIGW